MCHHPSSNTDQQSIKNHHCAISFPANGKKTKCPVLNCPAKPSARVRMFNHFCIRHPLDRLTAKQAGKLHQCPHCNKHSHTLSPTHFNSKECKKGRNRLNKIKLQCKHKQAQQVKFCVKGQPIERVPCFKHLGRILAEDNNDDIAIVEQIKLA